LAVEIAIQIKEKAEHDHTTDYTWMVGVAFLAVALVFVWRSFYAMRIPPRDEPKAPAAAPAGALTAGKAH
jgi:hypothetical protein